MRDVIQSVIATETEARGIVATARAEADRILAEAQKTGQELVARTRHEARVEAERMLDVVVNEAGREKQEHLSRVAAGLETQVRFEASDRERAIGAAVRCVCGQR
jgi:vacuolar-type H+-ATPase subunit H